MVIESPRMDERSILLVSVIEDAVGEAEILDRVLMAAMRVVSLPSFSLSSFRSPCSCALVRLLCRQDSNAAVAVSAHSLIS